MSVNAVNVGSRNMNITYLGLYIKDQPLCAGKKLVKLNEEHKGIGLIAPTEIKTEHFGKEDLSQALMTFDKGARVYLCAMDSEDKKYLKKIGRVDDIVQSFAS